MNANAHIQGTDYANLDSDLTLKTKLFSECEYRKVNILYLTRSTPYICTFSTPFYKSVQLQIMQHESINNRFNEWTHNLIFLNSF